MSNTAQDPKPDGAAFDDYFESLQKKADTLTTESGANAANEDDDEPRVVDEIESLCMNCHENVCPAHVLYFLKFELTSHI